MSKNIKNTKISIYTRKEILQLNTGVNLHQGANIIRTNTKYDIHKYQNSHKGRVPNEVIATAMAKYYHFYKIVDYLNDSKPKLAMYIEDYKSPRVGLYTCNPYDILDEVFKLYPSFTKRRYQDLEAHIINKVHTVQYPDEHPAGYLVPVKNGIFNRKTYKLMDFSPKYHFTKKIATDYPTNIEKVKKEINKLPWNVNDFISAITGGKKDLMELLWQVLCITFNVNRPANKLIWLKGTYHGANGKSTFERLIENIIGNYLVSSERLTDFGNSFGLSSIPGSVAVIGDDVDANAYVNSTAMSNMKSLIGGDSVEINQKNKPPFRYNYYGTIIQSSNGTPQFKDNGGLQRRLLIIPFEHEFKDQNIDVKQNYTNKDVVKEYTLYKALNIPKFTHLMSTKETREAARAVMEDSNPLIDFESNVMKPSKLSKFPTKPLYEVFIMWCKKNGRACGGSSRKFIQRLGEILKGKFINKQERITKEDTNTWINIINVSGINDDKHQLPDLHTGRSKCFVKINHKKHNKKQNNNQNNSPMLTDWGTSDSTNSNSNNNQNSSKINLSNVNDDDLPF